MCPTNQPRSIRYRARLHRRWPMRLAAGVLTLSGLLGLWQFVAHQPAISTHAPPTLQDAEQQLQLNNGTQGWFSTQGAPRPPDTVSGTS